MASLRPLHSCHAASSTEPKSPPRPRLCSKGVFSEGQESFFLQETVVENTASSLIAWEMLFGNEIASFCRLAKHQFLFNGKGIIQLQCLPPPPRLWRQAIRCSVSLFETIWELASVWGWRWALPGPPLPDKVLKWKLRFWKIVAFPQSCIPFQLWCACVSSRRINKWTKWKLTSERQFKRRRIQHFFGGWGENLYRNLPISK